MPVKATSKVLKTYSDQGWKGRKTGRIRGGGGGGQNKLAGKENEEEKDSKRGKMRDEKEEEEHKWKGKEMPTAEKWAKL